MSAEPGMYVLRLFHRDRPFEVLDTRLIEEGETTIGRDPAADWMINDPDCMLSRIHGAVRSTGNMLSYCDRSANGSFRSDGTRLPRNEFELLVPEQMIHFGNYAVLVQRESSEPVDPCGTRIALPFEAPRVRIASDWDDDQAAPPAFTEGRMSPLEAFCEGANLDSSQLTADDADEVMRRVGAMYREMLLGLSALMTARAEVKSCKGLDHTTIAANENNPLKWAGSKRLAVELLFERNDGFLTGAPAIRASFEDLANHLAGIGAGASSAMEALLSQVAPARIEAEAAHQNFSFRGHAVRCWDLHKASFVDPKMIEVLVEKAFREGYDRGEARGDL